MADDYSITAYFGGDTAGLKSAVQESSLLVGELEARFEASGAVMASAPKKLAEASAQAFKDIFAGEETLAAYREKIAFSRMNDEEKLTVLRGQAGAMLEKILSIEGTTAEKLNLQLQFEQKKTQIFELNNKAIAEAARAASDQTAEMGRGNEQLVKSRGFIEDIKKGFKDMGVSLQGAGVGVIFAAIIALTKEAVKEAQAQRDEYEKLGKPLDNATRSMASLGDAIKSAKEASVSAAGYILGGWTQIGELWGSLINRARGISEAQEEAARRGARAAEEADARVRKSREENNDPDKIKAAEKRLADFRSEQALARMNDEDRMNALLMKSVQLAEKINHGGAEGVKLAELKLEQEETLAKIREQHSKWQEGNVAHGKELLAIADQMMGKGRTLAEEERDRLAVVTATTEQLQQQVQAVDEMKNAWSGTTIDVKGAPDYAKYSSDMLEGMASRLRQQRPAGTPNVATDYGTWLTQKMIDNQLGDINKELGSRRSVSAFMDRNGEAATRRQFGDFATDAAISRKQGTSGLSDAFNSGAISTGNAGADAAAKALAQLSREQTDMLSQINAQLKKLMGGG